MSEQHIAVLTGGLGSERPIALQSATNVAKALSDFYQVETFTLPEELETFVRRHKEFSVAVPVMHGKGGEDGSVQGLLTLLGMPFIFSDILAHAIGLNKVTAKQVVQDAGVLSAPYRFVEKNEPVIYERPVVIKPIDSGSSVGISVAKSAEELRHGLAKAFEESPRVFMEDYIEGEEFSVAVIEDQGEVVALPAIAIRSKNSFFDYEAKYQPGMAEEICPAPIDEATMKKLHAAAVKAHQAIGARHVSRSDFILDKDGHIWFLEINTIPGMSVLLPKAIKASGRDFGGVLKGWVEEVIH